jgi:hypothetical protein
LPSRHQCHASSSWTTATINNDDPVQPKNVPWNWLRPSIGTTAKAKGRRRIAGALASASATTTMPPALRSDDGTILDRAARARAVLLPQRRRCRGEQGQRWRRRDPRQPRELRRTRRRKRASHNGGQSAGLCEVRIPAPVGGGGVAERRDGDG